MSVQLEAVQHAPSPTPKAPGWRIGATKMDHIHGYASVVNQDSTRVIIK